MTTSKEARAQLLALEQANPDCAIKSAITDLYAAVFNPRKISPEQRYLLNRVDHLLTSSEVNDTVAVRCIGGLYQTAIIGPHVQVPTFECPHKAHCPLYDVVGVKVRTAAK